VSLALIRQLGESVPGKGGGGTISLADYCSIKAAEASRYSDM
jgi:hypothetical protein